MSEPEVTVTRRRRPSAIWLVPIVSLVLGAWMVVHTLQSQGPLIRIVFSSGSGIEPGKTKIKALDVQVGLVETVGLADDLEHVVVTARLDKAVTPLLVEDTQLWVVLPRITAGGVSGLGTLLSGSYIQLAPGTGEPGRRDFVGLDEPPVTPAGAAGLHFSMVGDWASSLSSGDPVLYKGLAVGRIESSEFDIASQKVRFDAFVEAPYDELVTTTTRFWNASGFSLSATANGIEVQVASIEALLIGGVDFGLPEGVQPGERVVQDTVFTLYANKASMNEQPYEYGLEYVVRFPSSLRGLQPGAPVEYRGIRVGHVERVLLEEMVAQGLQGEAEALPVLIRIEPGRFALPDSEEGKAMLAREIEQVVEKGARVTLATGNLLTGSMYIYIDIYDDAPPAKMGTFEGRPTIPTIPSGLAGLERKLSAVLDKVNELPIERTLDVATQVLADLSAMLGSEEAKGLPVSLDGTLVELQGLLRSVSAESRIQEQLLRTITELDRTLESFREVLSTLEDKPNSLIFSREPRADPRPPAGSP